MDETTVDPPTRRVGARHNRRGSLRALGATVAAVAAPGLTTAGRRCRRRYKLCDPRPLGASCRIDRHCCADETSRICAIAFNAPTAALTCCGGTQAQCVTDDDCCRGNSCDDELCDL
jgi:hypothetical protein